MWSSLMKYTMKNALDEFHKAIYYSPVALRRLQDFHDEAEITKITQFEKTKILGKFQTKNCNMQESPHLLESLKELEKQLDNHIVSHLIKNQDHREQSKALIEKLADFLCKDYKTTADGILSLDSYMKLDKLEELLEIEKADRLMTFRMLWRHAPKSFISEMNSEFEEKFEGIHKEILEKQRNLLDEREQFYEQIKGVFLAMSRELIRDLQVSKQDEHPKEHLEERAKIILDYLFGKKGNKLEGFYPDIHDKLVFVIKHGSQVLQGRRGNSVISRGDAIQWAQNMDTNVKECFVWPKTNQLHSSSMALSLEAEETGRKCDKDRLTGKSNKRRNLNSEEENFRISKRQKPDQRQPLERLPVAAEDKSAPTLVLQDLQTCENLSTKEIANGSSEGRDVQSEEIVTEIVMEDLITNDGTYHVSVAHDTARELDSNNDSIIHNYEDVFFEIVPRPKNSFKNGDCALFVLSHRLSLTDK